MLNEHWKKMGEEQPHTLALCLWGGAACTGHAFVFSAFTTKGTTNYTGSEMLQDQGHLAQIQNTNSPSQI